jgi:hypothetical protein
VNKVNSGIIAAPAKIGEKSAKNGLDVVCHPAYTPSQCFVWVTDFYQ